MKSERAKDHIEEFKFMDSWNLDAMYVSAVVEVVELAEDDAEVRDRERAINAFSNSCEKHHNDTQRCWSGYTCAETNCSKKDDFIKHYDKL